MIPLLKFHFNIQPAAQLRQATQTMKPFPSCNANGTTKKWPLRPALSFSTVNGFPNGFESLGFSGENYHGQRIIIVYHSWIKKPPFYSSLLPQRKTCWNITELLHDPDQAYAFLTIAAETARALQIQNSQWTGSNKNSCSGTSGSPAKHVMIQGWVKLGPVRPVLTAFASFFSGSASHGLQQSPQPRAPIHPSSRMSQLQTGHLPWLWPRLRFCHVLRISFDGCLRSWVSVRAQISTIISLLSCVAVELSTAFLD